MQVVEMVAVRTTTARDATSDSSKPPPVSLGFRPNCSISSPRRAARASALTPSLNSARSCSLVRAGQMVLKKWLSIKALCGAHSVQLEPELSTSHPAPASAGHVPRKASDSPDCCLQLRVVVHQRNVPPCPRGRHRAWIAAQSVDRNPRIFADFR